MNNKFQVCHRYLVKEKGWQRDFIEIKILEVSPAGKIKVRYLSGSVSWEDANEFIIEEDLGVTD